MDHLLTVFLTAAAPITEISGAVPLGIAVYKLDPLTVLLVSIAGNLIPVVLVMPLLTRLVRFTRALHPAIDSWLEKFFKFTHHKHSAAVERLGVLFLFFFVALPGPFSGAWTGSLLAYLFGIKFRHALFAMTLGIIVTGIIAVAVSMGIVGFLQV